MLTSRSCHTKSPNQALELTAARAAFSFVLIKTFRPHLTLARAAVGQLDLVRSMDAVVEIINQTRGMVAARSADGESVILEILASDIPEKGDIVSHTDFHSMERETYRNKTQGTDLDVFVQNVVGSIGAAKKQCFLA
jgi:hypothetical protein